MAGPELAGYAALSAFMAVAAVAAPERGLRGRVLRRLCLAVAPEPGPGQFRAALAGA